MTDLFSELSPEAVSVPTSSSSVGAGSSPAAASGAGCLGCNLIEVSQVTLRSGMVVCSSCEAWRFECEARMVAGLPSLDARREYLDGVRKERGSDAADALRAEVLAERDRKA